MMNTGRIEDAIVDGIRFVVPEPVRVKTSEWWTAAKSVFVGSAAAADDQAKGDDDTTVMGVETATAGRREEASMLTPLTPPFLIDQTCSGSSSSMHVRVERARTDRSTGLATQFALAYAIHKSFIVFRIPLTAAVTPKIVKTLRSWGWNIGKPLK